MTNKEIGIGTVDFKEVILENKYYVDKTEFIKEVIDDGSKVLLITRPRRFGKTLNMSMLSYYFDIAGKYNKELFKGLNISKYEEKYKEKMGAYPVIYLSLAEVKGTSYESVVNLLKGVLMDLYNKYKFLLKSDKLEEYEKERINNILFGRATQEQMALSIKELCMFLSEHYERPVFLIIDEYDVPLQNSYVENHFEKTLSLFKTMYLSALKQNPYITKAVVTRSVKDSKRKHI